MRFRRLLQLLVGLEAELNRWMYVAIPVQAPWPCGVPLGDAAGTVCWPCGVSGSEELSREELVALVEQQTWLIIE